MESSYGATINRVKCGCGPLPKSVSLQWSEAIALSMSDIAIRAIERERIARIAKNREDLKRLGLYRTPEKAPPPRKKSTTSLKRKQQEPTRKVVPRNCYKQHDNLSESTLAQQLLFSREPEVVPASRFGQLRMGKRKSLSPVDWSPEFTPPDGTESDASELYHLLLPHLKNDVKTQQVAIWLVKEDITRGNLVAASDDEAAAFMEDLKAYLNPTAGMKLRLNQSMEETSLRCVYCHKLFMLRSRHRQNPTI